MHTSRGPFLVVATDPDPDLCNRVFLHEFPTSTSLRQAISTILKDVLENMTSWDTRTGYLQEDVDERLNYQVLLDLFQPLWTLDIQSLIQEFLDISANILLPSGYPPWHLIIEKGRIFLPND